MRARDDARGTVELRGPTWWLRRPGRDANGKRLRRVRLGPKTELRTEKQARAAADEWLERSRVDVVKPGRQILAVAYLVHFRKTHMPLMRWTSQAQYRSILATHIEPRAAGRRLRDLDTPWLHALIAEVAAKYERKTVMNIRGVALHVLRQAIRDGYGACRIDPREVRVPRQSAVRRQRRFITGDELDRILDASPWPWRLVWALMGYGGLRVGEALGVAWEHIDLDHDVISVQQNAVRGRLGAPKTETSQADVPILPALRDELAGYQAWRIDHGENLQMPTGLLFTTRNGTPFSADDVRRRVLHPLLQRLGIPKAGHHAFRHGVPRMLAALGISGPVIQQVMRHGTLAQTEEYLHVRASDMWTQLEAAGVRAAA